MTAVKRLPRTVAAGAVIGCALMMLHACGPTGGAPEAPAASVASAAPTPPPNDVVQGGLVRFGAGLEGVPFLTSGWSTPEAWGVWSEGPAAQVTLPLAKIAADKPLTLSFKVSGFVAEPSPQQQVAVKVDGQDLGAWSWTFAGGVPAAKVETITVPAEALAGKTSLVIDFAIARPTSPASVNMNSDARALGLQLVDVGFSQ